MTLADPCSEEVRPPMNGATDTMRLYRAVRDEELDDIHAKGRFSASAYGSEAKYFTDDLLSASRYARRAYQALPHEGSYTGCSGALPEDALPADDELYVDRGIRTIMITNETLPEIDSIQVYDHLMMS